MSRRRLKRQTTVSFYCFSDFSYAENEQKHHHLEHKHRNFPAVHDSQCSFATWKASFGDHLTIPVEQSFVKPEKESQERSIIDVLTSREESQDHSITDVLTSREESQERSIIDVLTSTEESQEHSIIDV